MDINNNDRAHSFNLQEHSFLSSHIHNHISTEWENSMHVGHDASYIIRKRSLLLDLWNMELPCTISFMSSSLSKEEENAKNYRDYAQKEFLKEVIEDKESWYVDEALPPKKDHNWNWDCPATIQ